MMPSADWSICPQGDFVKVAVEKIVGWIDDPAAHVDDCRRARHAFEAALTEAQTALDNFVHWVCREPDHGFVLRSADVSPQPGSASV
jgi:hypothetical protein